MRRTLVLATLASAFLAATGCVDGEDVSGPDEEWGMEGPVEQTPAPGKEDSEYRKGILVSTNTTRTQVWTAKNKWEDKDTTAAKKAGLGWGENSGLTWDEKYGKWLESMDWTPSLDGYSQTFILTTPWGKTLPSPMLECAEMSIFLRVTFAAWYELPFYMEGVSNGTRIYVGHNGVRTATGRFASTPEFAIVYKDYTAAPPATWPKDNTLRAKTLWGGDDNQRELAEGAKFGAYVDEIHLNKRAAYFTVMLLNYFGSSSLADTANTYNIVPEAVRAGDTLIERWQRSGIGHTLVVKEVVELGEGNKDITTISGSMPRRQGKRESGVASKSYFTSEYTGGEGSNYDGDEYAKLGGGLKRWRVTKNVNGYWTNTWMASDEAHWINSTDYPRIAARPARFESMLGQVSPEQQKTELLAQIEDARRHLGNYPASCSARERRERAFEDLYDLGERSLGLTRTQIDAEYRELSDYVLGELMYAQSKTCCWNSTTTAMADIVMDYAEKEQADAAAAGTCVAPTVFKNENGGYQRWADYAAATGRAAQWKAWSEDETCAQKNVANDTAVTQDATPYCELEAAPAPGGGTCTDAYEPNNSRTAAKTMAAGSYSAKVCASDEDWFKSVAGGVLKITFTHSAGDLDLIAYNASGAQVAASESTANTEQVTVPAGGFVKVFGYNGALNSYSLIAP